MTLIQRKLIYEMLVLNTTLDVSLLKC